MSIDDNHQWESSDAMKRRIETRTQKAFQNEDVGTDRCTKCGQMLEFKSVPAWESANCVLINNKDEMQEFIKHIQRLPKTCPSCKRTFCSSCAYNSQIKRYVCPNCGMNL